MLDLESVAQRLNVSVNTVRNLVKRGELPAYRIGNQLRFEEEEVKAYIASRRVTPQNPEQPNAE